MSGVVVSLSDRQTDRESRAKIAAIRDQWIRVISVVAEANAVILGTMQANLDEVEVLLAARDLDAAEFEQMVGRHRPQIVFLIDYFLLEQRNLFDRSGIEFVDDDQPQDAPA